MRTELLFESCPFLTSANVTLSRLGFADGDALWEIMQDEELYRYEYEAPAKERVQAEYKIQDANAQFAAKRTVTLGVYANTDLAHLIGWIEIGGADEGMRRSECQIGNAVQRHGSDLKDYRAAERRSRGNERRRESVLRVDRVQVGKNLLREKCPDGVWSYIERDCLVRAPNGIHKAVVWSLAVE